jgi:hypothetical protein
LPIGSWRIVGIAETRATTGWTPGSARDAHDLAQRQANWGWMSWQIVMARACRHRSGDADVRHPRGCEPGRDLPLQSAATVEALAEAWRAGACVRL